MFASIIKEECTGPGSRAMPTNKVKGFSSEIDISSVHFDEHFCQIPH